MPQNRTSFIPDVIFNKIVISYRPSEKYLSMPTLSTPMSIKKNQYLQNFVVACAGGIGLAIVFLAFGLNVFHSLFDTLLWFGILIGFLIFLGILKFIFPWIKIRDLVDGIWIGIVLYCWSPIVTLPWKENVIDALKGSSVYFLIGLVILIIGYLYRRRK
ncbi:MAG: hypothetical protein ACTSW3_04510 [Promethearchaeota archaeon]